MLEEAQREFDSKNPPHRLVHHTLGNLAGTHLGRDDRPVEVALHIHIYAGFQRLAGHRRAIADGMVFQLTHRSPVGNYKPVKAPFLA